MAKYCVGDKVLSVKTNEKGVVIGVSPPMRGRQLYQVRFRDSDTTQLETNLLPDADITDPFECCKKQLFGSYLDFSRINTTYKISNTSNNTISSLKASRTLFKPYQFKPLLKFLNSPNRRLIIADEVGLGKTIEAGHIMMELAARQSLKRVLVICPKMLREKWKTELKEKFNFNFKVYESKKDLISDLQSGVFKGIINYEFIRSKERKNEEQNDVIKLLSEQNVDFDFILCDEAHRLRNDNTQLYKGAKELLSFTTSAVFMTATPIMISAENLYNQLHLLDNYQFNNKEIFNNYIEINRPFITAISQLNTKTSLLEIAEQLKTSEISVYYGSDGIPVNTIDDLFSMIPLYQKIIKDLTTGVDSIEKRAQLQLDMSSMSMLNNIFSRTRKRDVTTDLSQPVREPRKIIVKLFNHEREEFNAVIDQYYEDHSYIDEYGDEKLSPGHVLGLIQKKRRIASSVYGYLNSTSDLDKGIDRYRQFPDAKIKKLLEILNEVVKINNKKIIVFALFKNTLKYLSIRLKSAGYKVAIIHGDITERESVLYNFKTDNSINILLSSEVGSEGLDMQFCDALVNYDLPWNPMVVEQRIGRIDRFGQNSQKVNIYNLIVKDSIQEDIYERLLDRIDMFRKNIGDLEAILDAEVNSKKIRDTINNLEKELYCTKLTEKERREKIETISKAIIFEKQHLEEINEGLTNALTNDIYFKNEILQIQKNYRYITDIEIYKYLKALTNNHLTECSLSEHGKGLFKLSIPLSNKKYLINFLHAYQPQIVDNDTELMFRHFISRIRDKTDITITFDQETAYNDQSLIFVNAYHPITISAKEFFQKKLTNSKLAYQFGISIEYFSNVSELKPGEYFLGVYVMNIEKKWFGKTQNTELLVPLVYDIQKDTIIDNRDVSERFLGEAQLNATVNEMPFPVNEPLVDNIRLEMTTVIDSLSSEYIKDQEMRLNTSKELQKQQVEFFYTKRIEERKKIITDMENKARYADSEAERIRFERALPAQRGLLDSTIEKRDEELNRINESKIIGKEPKLLSVSQIKIF